MVLPQTRRSRALVLTTSYPRFEGDSAGHFVEAEAWALVRSGHEVTVLCAGREGAGGTPRRKTSPALQVKFLGGATLFDHPGAWPRVRKRPWRALGFFAACFGALGLSLGGLSGTGRSFDRVIAHWLIPCAFPWSSWFAWGAPTFEAVAHGSDVELLLKLPAPFRWTILRSLKKRKTQLRFVSNRMKQDLLHSSPPHDLQPYLQKADVQAAALDLEFTVSRSVARARLGLDPTERWAVFAGRLIEQKRPNTALAAATLIADLRIAVLGDGPLRKRLEEEFPDVRFLGQTPRETALTWLAAADLCLATSLLEGAPTTVREARALGTPVVARECGDCAAWGRDDPELWIVG